MVKRVLIGFLLMVFLYNAGGYYLCFSYYQQSIRREMKMRIRRGLPQEELTEIIVGLHHNKISTSEAKAGISWVKPGKKFRYKGGLYDVVKTSFKNGKKHIYCINDTREKKLLTELMKLKTRKFEKRIKTVVSFFNGYSDFVVMQHEMAVVYGSYTNYYESSPGEVLSPPPPTV